MKCPKCEEGKICKVTFKTSGRSAYLCDYCGSFWYEGEHIDVLTGHTLVEEISEPYVFIQEADKEQKEYQDEEDRVWYEIFG